MEKKNITVSVVSTTTKSKQRKLKLPSAIFGQNVNEKLLTQAIRVYGFCKRQGTAKVKTRAEIKGSSRKIWRQKGTGRARHGDRYAPIFVGGGVAHGPQPRDWSLKLPKKMRRRALFNSLSIKIKTNNIYVIDGLDKLEPKTRVFCRVFKDRLNFDLETERVLLIVKGKNENIWRSVRNIENLKTLEVSLLNAYDILRFKKVVFTKDAIQELENIFLIKNEKFKAPSTKSQTISKSKISMTKT